MLRYYGSMIIKAVSSLFCMLNIFYGVFLIADFEDGKIRTYNRLIKSQTLYH